MRIIALFLFIFGFMLPTSAEVITGGVEFNTNSARAYLLYSEKQIVPDELLKSHLIDTNKDKNLSMLLSGQTELKDRTLAYFSDGSYGINYHNTPKYVWYYSPNGVLTHSEVKETLSYPYKTYKYSTDKTLINMSLRISETETYIFTPEGKLLAHWIGEECYDEEGKVIMRRRVVK